MKEKSTYKRFDLVSALAVLAVVLVFLFEAIFIFEFYRVDYAKVEPYLPASVKEWLESAMPEPPTIPVQTEEEAEGKRSEKAADEGVEKTTGSEENTRSDKEVALTDENEPKESVDRAGEGSILTNDADSVGGEIIPIDDAKEPKPVQDETEPEPVG